MPHRPATILILTDQPHPEKQWAIAHAAATAEKLRVHTICHHWHACLALILTRHIRTVISALDPGEDARKAIATAGGHLVVAREEQSRVHRSIHQMVTRLTNLNKGMDSQEMAYVLDVSTADVRRALAEIRRRESPE